MWSLAVLHQPLRRWGWSWGTSWGTPHWSSGSDPPENWVTWSLASLLAQSSVESMPHGLILSTAMSIKVSHTIIFLLNLSWNRQAHWVYLTIPKLLAFKAWFSWDIKLCFASTSHIHCILVLCTLPNNTLLFTCYRQFHEAEPAYSHFQFQSSASWGGRGRHWHGSACCWWGSCSVAAGAGTGLHTALSPPQTATLGTRHHTHMQILELMLANIAYQPFWSQICSSNLLKQMV